MKVQVFLSVALAVASASWIPHSTKYHGAVIHNGVPVDTPEVQHARQYHLSALAKAASYPTYGHDESHNHYEEKKYEGPQHIPVIHNGVPVETPEVQHARESHFQAIAKAQANSKYEHHDNYDQQDNHYNQHDDQYNHHDDHQDDGQYHHDGHSYNHYNNHDDHSYNHYNHHEDNHYNHHGDNSYNHYDQQEENHYETAAPKQVKHAYETSYVLPQIGHDGKPLDTPEVEAAKAHHLAAVEKALASSATTHNYRHRRDVHWGAYNAAPQETPEVEQARNEHLLAHAAAKHAGENGYAIHQIHAPVYGYHGDHYVPSIGHDGKVLDTEEVEHAKAAHFAAHHEALNRLHSHYEPEWKYAFEH